MVQRQRNTDVATTLASLEVISASTQANRSGGLNDSQEGHTGWNSSLGSSIFDRGTSYASEPNRVNNAASGWFDATLAPLGLLALCRC